MTEFDPRAQDALEWLRRVGPGALPEKLGVEFLEFSVDRCVATIPVEGNTQPMGLLHGGAYVVLGETLGSMAAGLWAGPGRFPVGVDVNATHTRGPRTGTVTGVCTPLHLGRSMTVHEIVISDDEGRRCSTVRITNMLRDAPAR